MYAMVPRKTFLSLTSSRSFTSFVQRNCHYNLRVTTEDGGKSWRQKFDRRGLEEQEIVLVMEYG